MSAESDLHPTLTTLPMMSRIKIIGKGQELPPSEYFLYDEDYCHSRRNNNTSSRGLVNDALNKALNQVSKSPFTRWIEEGRFPRRFTQPTFTLYNGRTDPIEHVSHFNQKIAIYSKNEVLMCKVFPFSLGPVAIR